MTQSKTPLMLLCHTLVPFSARRTHATAAYVSRYCDLDGQYLVQHHAYLTDAPFDPNNVILYAERYGGTGTYTNGGGGRCGYDGTVQIKGVGPTPLSSRRTDASHSDGTLSLEKALAEAFWTDLLAEVLPSGTVKVLAVLALSPGRALLIREPSVRIAHFERAVYFKPDDNANSHRLEDLERVRTNVRQIEYFLPSTDSETQRAQCRGEQIARGIRCLAERYAVQLAYSRSVFLTYSLTSSNLTIDGRWLDVTALSLHPIGQPRTRPYRVAWDAFWSQELTFSEILKNLLFYVDKYSCIEPYSATDIVASSLDAYKNKYRESLACYFLCFAGIPLFAANSISKSNKAQRWAILLSDCLDQSVGNHSARDNDQDFLFNLTLAPEFLQKCGVYTSAISERSGDAQLKITYLDVMSESETFISQSELSELAFARAIFLNAKKFSSTRQEISFDYLIEFFRTLAVAYESGNANLENIFNDLYCRITPLLRYDEGYQMTCWANSNNSMKFDIGQDAFLYRVDKEVFSIRCDEILDYFDAGKLPDCPDYFDRGFWNRFINIKGLGDA